MLPNGFLCFSLQTGWNMTTTADSDDKKLPNNQSVLSHFPPGNQFIHFSSADGNRIWLFFFETFCNISKSLSPTGDAEWDRQTFFFFFSARAKHRRFTSDALINIYERVFRCSIQSAVYAALNHGIIIQNPSLATLPVLKQSIVKKQLSAITLIDLNGISSGTLKARHFPLHSNCTITGHAGKRLRLVWGLVRLYSSATDSQSASRFFFFCLKRLKK